MGRIFRYAFFIVFLLSAGRAAGQPSIESLQEQIRQAQEEIERSNELLRKTQKDKEVSQTQLKLVESRIRSRRDMIAGLEKQIGLLQGEITQRDRTVGRMTSELETLRQEYAAMIREAYKNQKINNFALFLFASEDFNDATRRIEFMRRYNRARELRARQLKDYSDSLSAEIARLNAQKQELDGTKTSHGSELNNLRKDETQHRSSVNQLKQQESKIAREVKAKQEQIDKAQKEIQRIIAEEAKKNQSTTRTAAEDRYIADLSGRFDDNKGKLPYPVRGGVIVDRFGTHQHPTQRGLTINNKGVNIAGDRGAEAFSVFEGTVSKVFVLPGYNNCVMVHHGNYITLYGNLATVAVRAGDKVSLNQRVGRLSESTNSDDVYLHFEIWKQNGNADPTNLNPEQWLRR